MINARDWRVILACVHSKNWNSFLPCEFPEACSGCLYHNVHGSHNVKKALVLYHQWEKECLEV